MTAMLPTLGSFSLIIALLAYIAAFLLYRGVKPKPGSIGDTGKARKAVGVAGISLLIASASLMMLLFAREYTVDYVFNYTSNDLPGIYVVSAFWAGQEGSFLLWALIAALFGYILCTRIGEWEAPVMGIYLPSVIALVLMTIMSGPFSVSARVVAEGSGLNPLLRDPWMAIHPPVTFIGYAAMAVPFCFALVGLTRDKKEDWARPALPWALLGWLTLGMGIIMGGYWAYKVLGWGGWWGWDPVENASLLPWITGTALFHGLLLQLTRNKLARTNIMLAVVTFGLVIYSTFLTRSGVLEGASVHTFGASVTGPWLALWLLSIVGYGSFRLYAAKDRITSEKLDEPMFSREVLLTVGIIVLILSTAVIGLGTSAPMFSRFSGGEGAAVDISFYGRTTLPLGILLVLSLGISVLVPWKGTGSTDKITLWVSVAGGVVGIVAAFMLGVDGALLLLFAGGSAFALVVSIMKLINTLSTKSLGAAGGPISHVGATLMLIAIIAATTGTKAKVDLVYETPVMVQGYELTFTGWRPEPGGKRSATVLMKAPGSSDVQETYPKLYQQYGSGQMMWRAEPHIERSLFSDVYIAPAQFLPPQPGMTGAGEALSLVKGESVEIDGFTFTFEDFEMGGHADESGTQTEDGSIGARVRVELDGISETITPRMSFGGAAPQPATALPGEGGQTLSLQSLNADYGTVSLVYSSDSMPVANSNVGGILTVELSVKPFMTVLWLGVILALLGGGLAVWRRTQQLKV